jgi:hypothetical protein
MGLGEIKRSIKATNAVEIVSEENFSQKLL